MCSHTLLGQAAEKRWSILYSPPSLSLGNKNVESDILRRSWGVILASRYQLSSLTTTHKFMPQEHEGVIRSCTIPGTSSMELDVVKLRNSQDMVIDYHYQGASTSTYFRQFRCSVHVKMNRTENVSLYYLICINLYGSSRNSCRIVDYSCASFWHNSRSI